MKSPHKIKNTRISKERIIAAIERGLVDETFNPQDVPYWCWKLEQIRNDLDKPN